MFVVNVSQKPGIKIIRFQNRKSESIGPADCICCQTQCSGVSRKLLDRNSALFNCWGRCIRMCLSYWVCLAFVRIVSVAGSQDSFLHISMALQFQKLSVTPTFLFQLCFLRIEIYSVSDLWSGTACFVTSLFTDIIGNNSKLVQRNTIVCSLLFAFRHRCVLKGYVHF